MRYFTTYNITLKKYFSIFIILIACLTTNAQSLQLKINGANEAETRVIDSLSYQKIHEDTKSILDESGRMNNLLFKSGYLENRIIDHQKINDTVFMSNFSVGPKTGSIYIYTGKIKSADKEVLDITGDTVAININRVEEFMAMNMALLERKGYSFSTLQLTDYEKTPAGLTATLVVKIDKQRTLDDIVLEGYPKFPEGIRRNIARQYRKKTFNKDNLQRIYNDFNALRFVNQVRYPEVLFKQDTTKVYVYLEKAKPNTFDGFIGFTNDETKNRVVFTGYLDLMLNNVLNSGEKFSLFWKSDGNEQTTFNAGIELPYMFKSPIGLRASLRIFKQDSTFQNTATDINIGYYFSYNSKLFLGYQQTQSVDIQNLNSGNLSDYSGYFWTSTFEFTGYNINDFLFPEKTALLLKAGTGTRDAKTVTDRQYFIQSNISHNIYLNQRNIINLKNETYYLKSDNYIINELYRFGGINSFRGFNENSLQASLYTALMAEYRYVLAPNMYIHSITDYGYFQDKTSNLKNNLLGLGFGFGLLTKTGLFNLVYANGSTKDQQIKLSNSIVHLSFSTKF